MLLDKPKISKVPGPTLATVHRVELILRKAAEKGEPPLSLAEIERRLPAKKTRRETTKAAVAELSRLSLVARGPKGVMWVVATSDAIWSKAREPIG